MSIITIELLFNEMIEVNNHLINNDLYRNSIANRYAFLADNKAFKRYINGLI